MQNNPRIAAAAQASAKHLVASCIVALCCAALVFGLWYPFPYAELMGGRGLFFLLISVDVVAGPLLTLVIFNPIKSKRELFCDIGLVVMLQMAALGYGLHSVLQARPVLLAFEGDRFRVVRFVDIPDEDLANASEQLRYISLFGPRLVGVRLAASEDPDYMDSLQLAVQGLHPAFRPERWRDYEDQHETIVANAKPLAELRAKHADKGALIDEMVTSNSGHLGYLPLIAGTRDDWVVIIDLDSAEPKAFLPLIGW